MSACGQVPGPVQVQGAWAAPRHLEAPCLSCNDARRTNCIHAPKVHAPSFQRTWVQDVIGPHETAEEEGATWLLPDTACRCQGDVTIGPSEENVVLRRATAPVPHQVLRGEYQREAVRRYRC